MLAGNTISHFIQDPLGAYFTNMTYAGNPDARWINGIKGFHYVGRNTSANGSANAVPVNAVMILDQKYDDGWPLTGDIIIGSSCNQPDAAPYDPGNTTLCSFGIRSQVQK